MDSERTKDWRKDLTDADAAKVEDAARAAYAARCHRETWGENFSWDSASAVTRDGWLRDTLTTLRFVGVVPKAKPSRGEVVAEMNVEVFGDAVRFYGTPNVVVTAPGKLDKFRLRGLLRANFASTIDAERDAALEEAAKAADDYRPGPTGLIVSEKIATAIRALKSGGAK